jgi:nucleoside-diphosphate-sugar epimerase
MNKSISVFGCGWLGEPLAIRFTKNDFTVKGSTTSQHKISKLQANKIVPYLILLENLPSTILDFLTSEILVVNIPSKNVEGFKQLITHIEKSSVKKVIFISSTSVYNNSTEIITEETPIKDCDLGEIEQLFSSNKHFKTTIIRFAGLLGYERKPANFFKNGRSIPNPEGVVNMIHQDDCIKLIERVISKNCWNEIFNGCADTHPKRRDFYTKAFLDVNKSEPIFNENDEKKVKIISNTKVKKLLNFDFNYPDLMNLP